MAEPIQNLDPMLAPEPIAPQRSQSPALKPEQTKLQLIVLVVASVFLGLALIFGVFSGISYGRSEATFSYAQKINQALQYYNGDQGRYPTADHFYNTRILVPSYLSGFPQPADASGSCKNFSSFIYAQTSPRQFTMQFCLLQGTGGLSAGAHAFTEKGVQ